MTDLLSFFGCCQWISYPMHDMMLAAGGTLDANFKEQYRQYSPVTTDLSIVVREPVPV